MDVVLVSKKCIACCGTEDGHAGSYPDWTQMSSLLRQKRVDHIINKAKALKGQREEEASAARRPSKIFFLLGGLVAGLHHRIWLQFSLALLSLEVGCMPVAYRLHIYVSGSAVARARPSGSRSSTQTTHLVRTCTLSGLEPGRVLWILVASGFIIISMRLAI